jgi:RNA polymerase sigma-70 factor (ECF subfamily)
LIMDDVAPGHTLSVPAPAPSPLAHVARADVASPIPLAVSAAVDARPERAQSGTSAWTFDAVYDAYFSFVWRSVRRLGIADVGVDDVVQDIFVTVHKRLASFEERSSMKSWLFGITLHVVRDARRTLRRKPAQLGGSARSDSDVDLVADRASQNPHESAAKSEAVRTLHAVLDAMDDERREVFVLAELEQMTVPEIAACVGANPNTVYSRLRAARADFERAIARVHASDGWRMR